MFRFFTDQFLIDLSLEINYTASQRLQKLIVIPHKLAHGRNEVLPSLAHSDSPGKKKLQPIMSKKNPLQFVQIISCDGQMTHFFNIL